jgi:hypothetical protein
MRVLHHQHHHGQLGRRRVAGAAIAVALIGVGMTGLNGSPAGHGGPSDLVRFVTDGH